MVKIILTILLGYVAFIYAQTGSITGQVTNKATGKPLIGVNIILLEHQSGDAADLDGRYEISDLPVGSYNVQYSMIGYKTLIKNRVLIKPNRPTVLNVELEEEVTVGDVVVVRPSYFEKPRDAPVSARSMDYEEIAIQPGASFDIQRTVQALPSVVSSGDQDNEIIVRGGNYGENLFVLDNIEIPNPNHFATQGAGGGPVSAIYTDFVSEVDFIAGAFPAKYGDKASSVLDITLREGLRDKFHLKFDLGMHGAGGNIEGPFLNKKGSYMLAGHRSFLDLIASTWGLTAIPQYWNTQAKIVYDINTRLKLSFFSLYARDWIEVDAREEEQAGSDLDWYADSQTDQYALGINLKVVMKNAFATFTLSSTENNWNESVTDSLKKEEWFHNYSTERTTTLKSDWTMFPFRRNELSGGAYLKYNHFDYDYFDKEDTLFIYEPGTDSIIGSTGYIYGEQDTVIEHSLKYGGYLQYKHYFGALFRLNAGVRLDALEFTRNYYFSPRLSLTYNLLASTGLSVAYGRHYQPPDWYMLAFNGRGTTLDHYYSDQYVAGIDHLFAEDVRGTLEAYYKSYHDYPATRSQLTEDPYDEDIYFVNAVKGYAKGIEIFLQKKVKENLWGTLSYSYSKAVNRDPRATNCPDSLVCPYGEYPKSFDYGHVATFIMGYRQEFMQYEWYHNLKSKWWWGPLSWIPGTPSDESEYSFRFRYLGGRPYTEPTYRPEHRLWVVDPGEPYNQARMPEYINLDLHIQSRWYYGKWTLFTYFELDNAFNRKNIWWYQRNSDGTVDTVYQRGRMFVGGIIMEF
ncbi:TonB-dependent receptor [bacterium]|nr:TonB-dependent receptor [bacterium]